MKNQQTVFVTAALLRGIFAPLVKKTWRQEAETLFNGFDELGETAVEVNVSDSEIPEGELETIMKACNIYGLHAVRLAIATGIDLRPPECAVRDDIGAYKATLNY